jgi:serine protease
MEVFSMRRSAFALWCSALALLAAVAGAAEWNPVRTPPVSIGPETHRIIVGFQTTSTNAVVKTITTRSGRRDVKFVQAQTSASDVANLAQRTGLALAKSRQITPSMHVLFLQQTLYGADVDTALAVLRADPAVKFADVDERRYPLAASAPVTPTDLLFQPTPNAVPPASGQWYMLAPNPSITVEGVATMDLSATDAVDAWAITTGSNAIVIADVDTGILFDHPDLLRANLGGRLLPGYDFVGKDYNPNSGAPLGTYLAANDGDGWDPDPSDPGDWISSTDLKNPLFPPASCGDPTTQGPVDSSWHGTRVVGIFGAITNNGIGIAGMSWGPWILPVRALGKCGGYDSDIIAGIEWAAGMSVTPPNAATSSTATIPDNPFPADIINLSLGGGTTCSQPYQIALTDVTNMGVLVVISAGNSTTAIGPNSSVASPANCSALVKGVIAVAGLRNVGTKVGYSSLGPEVGVSAPAGNCINATGNCLRPIDTTTNDGLTGPDPAGYGYKNEQNANLGTSFSAPIVSGIAALMRSVNANLTPKQLVARLESSATPFPPNNSTPALPVCPNADPTSGECSCPPSGQCGTGMVNALSAVKAALNPIGVIVPPATLGSGSVFDASASVASCNNSLSAFAWTANPANLIVNGANTSKVTVAPGSGGTLTLTLTDSAGNVDIETVTLTSNSVTSSTAPTSAGTSAAACPAALAVNPAAPAAPKIAATVSPATVTAGANSSLTITFTNTNAFDLTQANFSFALPSGLTIPTTPQATVSCGGTNLTATYTTNSLTLANGIIPAKGSCAITAPVESAIAAAYTIAIAANALTTGLAGANTARASASLTVNAPSSKGGGAIEWPDLLLAASILLLIRRRPGRGSGTGRKG